MMIEMHCRTCLENFPLGDGDATEVIEHYEKADGTPCGSTETEIAGSWVAPQWRTEAKARTLLADAHIIRGYN